MSGSFKVMGMAVGLLAGAAFAEAPADGAAARTESTEESSYEATGAAAAQSPSDQAQAPAESADQPGVGGSGEAAAPGTVTRTETVTEDSKKLENNSSAEGNSNEPSHVQSTHRSTTTTQYGQSAATQAAPVATVEDTKAKKRGPNYRGVQVMVGGGVEGYTGSLATRVRAGGAYGATVAFKPTSVLGLEVAYSGAVNELKGGGGVDGADIVRNGVQGVATFGLSATAVQPYVLAGIGVNRYDVRAPASSGFRDDTSGNIPLGGGVRSYIGPVAIDARVTWNLLFANDFATAAADNTAVGSTPVTTSGGRYTATLSAGAAF